METCHHIQLAVWGFVCADGYDKLMWEQGGQKILFWLGVFLTGLGVVVVILIALMLELRHPKP